MHSRGLGEMDVDAGGDLAEHVSSSSTSDAGKKFLDQAARVMDLKKVVQPPSFDSKVEHWADYKFRTMSIFALLDLTDAIEASLVVSEGELKLGAVGPSMKVKSQLVYAMLVSGTTGKAQAMLRLVEPGEGFLAWRRINKEFEPTSTARHIEMISSILHPKFADGKYEESLLLWDRRIGEYEGATKTHLPGGVKTAVLLQNSPPKVREWMKSLTGDTLDNYDDLRTMLQVYLTRGRVYTNTGEPVAMEVDEVTAGGGPGTGERRCYRCGKTGHMKKDCRVAEHRLPGYTGPSPDTPSPQPQKGKGKGKGKSKGTAASASSGPSKGAGKNAGGQFQGNCRKCGKWGHKAADCRSVLVVAPGSEEEAAAGAVATVAVTPIESIVDEKL